MSRLTSRLHTSWLAWLLVPALPLLGVWWIRHSQSQGGGSPLLAKVLVGLGAVMLWFLIAGLLFLPLERLSDGRLKSFLSGTAVVLSFVVGLVAYSAVVDWAGDRASPVVEGLGVVCVGGAGAPDAKPVKGDGPFHAVVIGSDGQEVPWSEKSADWRADTVEETELVACIDVREKVVETCYYRPITSPAARKAVTRERSVVEVWLRAAHSGRQVAHFTIRHDPQKCPDQVDDDVERFIDEVEFEELSQRIAELTHTP